MNFDFRKLQCARVKLHMHLFISFIMRATMSYLKDILFYKGIALYSDVEYANGQMVEVNPHCVSCCVTRGIFVLIKIPVVGV